MIPLIYETIFDLIKWKTRPLNATEKEILFSVFGDSIKYNLIGLDPRSIPVIKRKTVAYVSFHTINFDTDIQDSTLVHEMVHVWQYQKYGAAYISEAFWAQRWGGGYNYGGLEALQKHAQGPGLSAFNFEQQADIIEEYFRWSKGLPLQWEKDASAAGEVLGEYARQIHGK
ncbi:MAG TPA: hypothetical protein VFG10_01650 [Saprospiraceae bacterium]|nr:hypothetical protein [Saprospiraceae bacterium]